ncbi:coil containing protein [Vibrio phage 1.190.O._10N.286.51.F12]|nr:coil containing protein [Vibrio phage 1.190.O._10N.286.51.F12]
MKNTYFKLVETKDITPRMLDDVGLASTRTGALEILESMKDKRGLVHGYIENTVWGVMPKAGEFHKVKMDAFVCSRTGLCLTLDFIKGFELSENSPSMKLEHMQAARKQDQTQMSTAGTLNNYPVSGDAISDGLRDLAGKKKADKKPARKGKKETASSARGLTTNIKNKIAKVALLVALPLLTITPVHANEYTPFEKVEKLLECQDRLADWSEVMGTEKSPQAEKNYNACMKAYKKMNSEQ